MMKKIFALLMASVLALGVFAVAASAEDVSEPANTTEYKIEDILAVIENGDEVFLLPGDTIVLPAAAEDAEAAAPAISPILIVDYLAGQDAVSGNGLTKFEDFNGSGYAIAGIGSTTDYAFKGSERKTNFQIDFANNAGYDFVQWKVESIYSGKEFNRITVSAEWAVPELKGWAGYKEMMSGYFKTIIDYVINYLIDLFARVSAFFV